MQGLGSSPGPQCACQVQGRRLVALWTVSLASVMWVEQRGLVARCPAGLPAATRAQQRALRRLFAVGALRVSLLLEGCARFCWSVLLMPVGVLLGLQYWYGYEVAG